MKVLWIMKRSSDERASELKLDDHQIHQIDGRSIKTEFDEIYFRITSAELWIRLLAGSK